VQGYWGYLRGGGTRVPSRRHCPYARAPLLRGHSSTHRVGQRDSGGWSDSGLHRGTLGLTCVRPNPEATRWGATKVPRGGDLPRCLHGLHGDLVQREGSSGVRAATRNQVRCRRLAPIGARTAIGARIGCGLGGSGPRCLRLYCACACVCACVPAHARSCVCVCVMLFIIVVRMYLCMYVCT
jgi:hypothetical protein